MTRATLLERRFQTFLHEPLSVRRAMAVIVTATLVSVLAGGVLITVLDPTEFPDLGTGLWWALQTVTTVGYGDVTPQNALGRLIGAVFMVEAIAFVAIVTAAITSSFVERAHRERTGASNQDATELDRVMVQLAEIAARLDDIQGSLKDAESPGEHHA